MFSCSAADLCSFYFQISEKVKLEKFEFSNFFCSLTFPVALLVREVRLPMLLCQSNLFGKNIKHFL